MKRNRWLPLVLFFSLCLVGCNPQEKTVNVTVNGVALTGHHTADSADTLQLDTTSADWLHTAFPEQERVHTEDVKEAFAWVGMTADEDTRTYDIALLPNGFKYMGESADGSAIWVQSSRYPKGWTALFDGSNMVSLFTEIEPDADYREEVDGDGYPFGRFTESPLDGLPMPAVKEIDIMDFPSGHHEMESDHYSIELLFQ